MAQVAWGFCGQRTHQASDTLVGDDLSRRDLNRLLLAVDDLLLPYRVDLSLFHTLKNEALLDHIRRRGIIIYENIHDAPSKEAL